MPALLAVPAVPAVPAAAAVPAVLATDPAAGLLLEPVTSSAVEICSISVGLAAHLVVCQPRT